MRRDTRLARARVLQGTRAGFVSRILAGALDIGVVALLETAIVAFIALVRLVIGSDSFHFDQPEGILAVVLTIAVAVVYLGGLWATTGRTVGEQILGLRTLTEHGSRLSLLRSYARACLTVIFPVGPLWILVSHKNASVQDILCRTAVVYDWSYHAPGT